MREAASKLNQLYISRKTNRRAIDHLSRNGVWTTDVVKSLLRNGTYTVESRSRKKYHCEASEIGETLMLGELVGNKFP